MEMLASFYVFVFITRIFKCSDPQGRYPLHPTLLLLHPLQATLSKMDTLQAVFSALFRQSKASLCFSCHVKACVSRAPRPALRLPSTIDW